MRRKIDGFAATSAFTESEPSVSVNAFLPEDSGEDVSSPECSSFDKSAKTSSDFSLEVICSLSLFMLYYRNQALFAEPNNSIFSRTVSLIASQPGARSFLGSNPLPSRSFPASMYFLTAAAKASWHSVLTLIFATPKEMAF